MNIISIIPARGDSKGIPKKNIIDFSGKPLIYWSIRQSMVSKMITDTYVTSDSDEILNISKEYGAIPIKRPLDLATDNATSESALLHAINHIEEITKKKIDYFVFLQATSPLRDKVDIDNAINTIIKLNADSLFSSSKLEDFFIWEDNSGTFKSINYDFQNRKRRQDVKLQFLENGSIYIFKPNILKMYRNRLGGKIVTYVMEFWKSHEIDSLEGKELCEWYFKNKKLNNIF